MCRWKSTSKISEYFCLIKKDKGEWVISYFLHSKSSLHNAQYLLVKFIKIVMQGLTLWGSQTLGHMTLGHMPLGHMPPGHIVTRPHRRSATQSLGHTVTRPHSHLATQSLGHTTTRPHSHWATSVIWPHSKGKQSLGHISHSATQ